MKHLIILLAFFTFATPTSADETKPNILWLSCEDISPHLGCFGDKHAITPHLDQLATEGVRFSHAFTAAGVCAPCRSTIITGMYQTTIGTHHMRCTASLPEFIKPFPIYLREAGYYCSNNSKKDYQFKEPKNTWDQSNGKSHWRGRKKGQPFFAVFNFTGCHESGIASAGKYRQVTKNLTPDQRQDPNKLELPPYYANTKVIREDWKRNYELITAMDQWAADLIAQLKSDGEYENTIIMYWSDHGVGLPRAKRWLYDSGTRIPMIVRIPKKFRVGKQGTPGTVDAQLVSSLDFGPTVLNLAGLPVPKHVQGRAFLGSNLTPPRDYVYGARDRMDERYDIIRAVRDSRYRYIRNYEPLKTYYQYMNTPEKGATMAELRNLHDAGNLPAAAELFFAANKPVEELYDLESDPHEINNLAGSKDHAKILKRLRAAHTQWVLDTKDVGLIPESELTIRKEKFGSEYAILRQPGGDALNARLGKTAALASSGPFAFNELLAALSDSDAAVRYWAATGLGNLGPQAKKAQLAITKTLNDSSPAVRIAAARALCRMGAPAEGLLVLSTELSGPHQWARLQAAIALDEMDEQAKPAISALKSALKNQPNKYIVRVANRAVNELLGTQNVVP